MNKNSPSKVTMDAFLRQPEVREHDVPLLVQEHVLRLEIPVDHVELVDILQREGDLRGVAAGAVLGELT